MKKSAVIIFILLLLIIGFFFYWQKDYNAGFNFNNPLKTPEVIPENSIATSEEIATSTPFEIPKGEISRGNQSKKQLIFTFDCGAGTNSAEKILEITAKHGIRATFFSTGKFAEKNPEVIKKFSVAGHEIFNHTYSHPYLTKITDEQIKEEFAKANEIISKLTGATTKPYFRPPYGSRNQHVLDIAQSLGYQSVFWTIDALDWMQDKTAEQVKAQIYSKITPGAIILMHVGDDITGQILDEVFIKLENDGYKIISLSEGLK
jgi:peptidoglycan/xylan/chitin deacetylase (PgdA/CDA1 family)